MPRKQLTQTEWNLVVRIVCDVEHLLHIVNGLVAVEPRKIVALSAELGHDALPAEIGVALNLDGEVDQLTRALRLLGYRGERDSLPPPTDELYIDHDS